jgi:ParB/RepB/Spo0J family partition protein
MLSQLRAGAEGAKPEPPKGGIEMLIAQLAKETMDDQGFNVPMSYLTLTRNIRGEIIRDEAFEALRDSLEKDGQIAPVLVQLINGKPTLVGGYRRYAALSDLGKTHIRITGKNTKHDWELLQIWENLHRADLPPIKFCEAVLVVHSKFPDDTMEQLAKRIGRKDRGQVTFFLKIARWSDDMKEEAMDQGLSLRALVEIAKKKESNTPEGLEMLLTGNTEKAKPEAAKATATNAKLLDRIKKILTDLPETARPHRKDFSKIAETFAGMQTESRAALLEMLRTLNTEDN